MVAGVENLSYLYQQLVLLCIEIPLEEVIDLQILLEGYLLEVSGYGFVPAYM